MKSLTITNEGVTREALLDLADRIPGAWMGIRIAAVLLFLDGWKTTRIAELFDISRWSMVKWIHRINEEGISGIPTKKRTGRPCRLTGDVQRELERALGKNPLEFGLTRNRWDGIVVVEYLERFHRVHLKVRQAQRWIKRLGFSLQRPLHRYVQATSEGIEEFEETVKKTPRTQGKQRQKSDAFL
jgi:transposase